MYICNRRCSFVDDNLWSLVEESLRKIQSTYPEIQEFFLDPSHRFYHVVIEDSTVWISIDREVLYLLDILSKQSSTELHSFEKVSHYIDIYFSWDLKYSLLVFFSLIFEKKNKDYFMYRYISHIQQETLRYLQVNLAPSRRLTNLRRWETSKIRRRWMRGLAMLFRRIWP